MILEWREDKGGTQGGAMRKGQEWQETRLEVKEESPVGTVFRSKDFRTFSVGSGNYQRPFVRVM